MQYVQNKSMQQKYYPKHLPFCDLFLPYAHKITLKTETPLTSQSLRSPFLLIQKAKRKVRHFWIMSFKTNPNNVGMATSGCRGTPPLVLVGHLDVVVLPSHNWMNFFLKQHYHFNPISFLGNISLIIIHNCTVIFYANIKEEPSLKLIIFALSVQKYQSRFEYLPIRQQQFEIFNGLRRQKRSQLKLALLCNVLLFTPKYLICVVASTSLSSHAVFPSGQSTLLIQFDRKYGIVLIYHILQNPRIYN